MLVQISPFSRSFDDVWITYFVPKDLEQEIKLWIILEIPLQSKITVWVVLDIFDDELLDIPKEKLKSIISIKNKNQLLFSYQVTLVNWIAKYYFSSISSSLSLFFPQNLRKKIENWKIDLNSQKKLNYKYDYTKELTSDQKIALKQIEESKNKLLFYWITGSWKTEIYINLIKKYLEKWQQSLIMIPEIILTNQIADRFQKIFWKDIVIINSSISDATKTKNRIDIFTWNAKIIIWTRSSLFYPYKDLWLIIIDEEHDLSYSSQNSPRIDSKEVASKICDLSWVKLILASGTPCIKNMYKAIMWEFEIVNLLKEYNKQEN